MRVFTIIKNVVKYIIKRIRFLNILLLVNTGVLIFMVFSFSLFDYIVLDFKRQVEIQKYIWRQEIRELTYALTEAIDSVTKIDKAQIEIDKQQQTKIEDLARMEDIVVTNIDKLTFQQKKMLKRLEETKTIDLDNVEDIKEANFLILNTTVDIQGSGSHIKIGENYYVLTAAHLIEDEEDFIWAIDNSRTWRPLGLIKLDKERDLALFRIYSTEGMPYLEISKKAPKAGSEVVVIGNPDYNDDVITDGIITKVTKDKYLFSNLVYFGNSGGAVLYKGKIVGIVVQMEIHFKTEIERLFVLVGSGPKLEVIQEFLKGVEDESKD